MSTIQMKASLYYFHKKTQEVKLTFDMIARATKFITRADDRTKTIGNKNTKFLIHAIEQELEANSRKPVFIDHDFMTKITDCLNDQNAKLLKRLSDIFASDYKHCIRYKGKLRSRGYMVQYTETGRDRLENPELFYDTNNELKQQKAKVIRPIKICAKTDKNRCTTYKEKEIEDSSYRAISSISKASKKECKHAGNNKTSPVVALPNLRGSNTGEFLAHPLKNKKSKPQEPIKPLKPRIVITAAMQKTIATGNILLSLPPVMSDKQMTTAEEKERYKAHRDRRHYLQPHNEPKPIEATIVSLLPRFAWGYHAREASNKTRACQKEVEFQFKIKTSEVCDTTREDIEFRFVEKTEPEISIVASELVHATNPYALDVEFRKVLADKAERKEIWQDCLRNVTKNMGETYDPLSGKMRAVSLEDINSQFGNMKYKIDLEAKNIKLQAKGELWIPAFELVYATKFKEAASATGYSFELVKTLE